MRPQSLSLVILAAGLGSRYGGLKQLAVVGPSGETILDYSVADALAAGFSEVVLIVRESFRDELRERLEARFPETRFVFVCQELSDLPNGFQAPSERSRPWGTAHATWTARDQISHPFVLINADDFYGPSAFEKAAHYFKTDPAPELASLVTYELSATLSENGHVNRGICETHSGYLVSVQEVEKIRRQANGSIVGRTGNDRTISLPDDSPVSMNFWAFHPEILPLIEECLIDFLEQNHAHETAECYLPSVINDLLQTSQIKCRALSNNGQWFGVTYPEDLAAVQSALAKRGRIPDQFSP